MVYKLAARQFAEVHVQLPDPKMKDPTLHHWKTYPVSLLYRVPLGPMQGQPQRTYLRPEKIGQFPLPQYLLPLHHQNRRTTPG